ncbi:MAG TPA: chemotaxis protein CheW [Anaeromyxobacteraceae bacterium]|nr:chemotaxis protein CheW [Anaeromyxobacteraceae bacterium]
MNAASSQPEEKHQFLSFAIGDTHFGVPILKVKEILQYEGVTRVPGSPASVRGVINVRGAVVPVVDLGLKFGRAGVGETKRTCVLVVETVASGEPLTLGVIADAVNEVIDLGAPDIEPPPAFGAGIRLDHITGMGKVAGGFVVMLDIDRVLSASEAELMAAVTAAAAAAEPPEAHAVA